MEESYAVTSVATNSMGDGGGGGVDVFPVMGYVVVMLFLVVALCPILGALTVSLGSNASTLENKVCLLPEGFA